MAKLSATLLFLALLAATAPAAPAPRAKAPPTPAQLRQILRTRGIVVKGATRLQGGWNVQLELSVVADGRDYRTCITSHVRADSDNERDALLALVESGKDAARLREEDAQERQQNLFIFGFTR